MKQLERDCPLICKISTICIVRSNWNQHSCGAAEIIQEVIVARINFYYSIGINSRSNGSKNQLLLFNWNQLSWGAVGIIQEIIVARTNFYNSIVIQK